VRTQNEADQGADQHTADGENKQQIVLDPSQQTEHHSPHLRSDTHKPCLLVKKIFIIIFTIIIYVLLVGLFGEI